MRGAKAERAAAAYATRPTLYKTTSKQASSAQTLPVQFTSSCHPAHFTANQDQPAPPARTTCKQARQCTAPAAGERAEDGSVAAPEQVGEMEGITPAPPQPPIPAAAPTNMTHPAFPPTSIAPTPS